MDNKICCYTQIAMWIKNIIALIYYNFKYFLSNIYLVKYLSVTIFNYNDHDKWRETTTILAPWNPSSETGLDGCFE